MIFWFQLLGPLDTLTDSLLTLSYGRFNLRRVWVVVVPKHLRRSRPGWRVSVAVLARLSITTGNVEHVIADIHGYLVEVITNPRPVRESPAYDVGHDQTN